MAVIYVENRPYEVAQEGGNLLHALLSLGFDVPYFCWHPALGSVGACRQCAVKLFRDENDARGQIVMSCMTPVKDGMRVSVDDPAVKRFRKAVIEWLMLSHPHDCPVCDEGGQCHLQDMTVMTGHNHRVSRFPKRTHRNQDLGPFVHHEMNRCIQCYRCVRFYQVYAGGDDLTVLSSRNRVYFGRREDGALESEFAGNLVEVCPTGVFTDKPARVRYARKWDLTFSPSVCLHCGVGCNTIISSRSGRVVRVENRYHHAINGYFLCDKGRFARDFIEDGPRLRRPFVRPSACELPAEISAEEAVGRAAEALRGRTIGIGSPRASLETNFALRELVGADNFSIGLPAAHARLADLSLRILRDGPVPAFTVREIEESDAALVLGEDVTDTAPRVALALRQASRRKPAQEAAALGVPPWQEQSVSEVVQRRNGPLFIANVAATRLDDAAEPVYHAAPDDLARFGFAVAAALDPTAPVVELPAELADLAQHLADGLKSAKRAAIVAGPTLGSEAILLAAERVARALKAAGVDVGLCLVQPDANTLGAAMLGGRSLDDVLAAARRGEIDTLVIAENDLYRRAPEDMVDELFATVKQVIAIDAIEHPTITRSTIAFPAATYAEANGTVINNEGRAQRFYRVLPPGDGPRGSWRWLGAMAQALGRAAPAADWRLDDVAAALAASAPAFARLPEVAPGADFRLLGRRIAHQPPRFSGRTAATANIDIREPQPPVDPDAPFAFSMEGGKGQSPAALLPFYWAPGWNSVQALNKFQVEVGRPLRGGDPGVRLIEPSSAPTGPDETTPPAPFTPVDDEWLVVALPNIFFETLALHSPPIAARAPDPHLRLNEADAARLGAKAGDQVQMDGSRGPVDVPLAIDASLPSGVAALVAPFAARVGFAVPKGARLRKKEAP